MIGPSVTVYLHDCKSPILLPVEQTVDTALSVLRATTSADLFYRQNAWNAVRCYLVASINFDDDEPMQTFFFTHPRSTEQSATVFFSVSGACHFFPRKSLEIRMGKSRGESRKFGGRESRGFSSSGEILYFFRAVFYFVQGSVSRVLCGLTRSLM